jgi:hypothetical protein
MSALFLCSVLLRNLDCRLLLGLALRVSEAKSYQDVLCMLGFWSKLADSSLGMQCCRGVSQVLWYPQPRLCGQMPGHWQVVLQRALNLCWILHHCTPGQEQEQGAYQTPSMRGILFGHPSR